MTVERLFFVPLVLVQHNVNVISNEINEFHRNDKSFLYEKYCKLQCDKYRSNILLF